MAKLGNLHKNKCIKSESLHEKFPNTKILRVRIFSIRTEYGDLPCKPLNSIRT